MRPYVSPNHLHAGGWSRGPNPDGLDTVAFTQGDNTQEMARSSPVVMLFQGSHMFVFVAGTRPQNGKHLERPRAQLSERREKEWVRGVDIW